MRTTLSTRQPRMRRIRRRALQPTASDHFVALVIIVCTLCEVGSSFAAESQSATWRSDFASAYRDALEHKRPILVRAGSRSCVWCEKLEDEIAKQEVQLELSAWTLLYVDVDKSPIDALRLNISSTPALRVLTPRGRLLASHDGYLEADKLIDWLDQHYEEAVASADDVLLAEHKPSLLEVVRIVRQFDERDAAIREAAIRRLLPYPKTAGTAVVNALKEGSLSSKLVAYELLTEWEAPLGDVDPWQPETLSQKAFESLEQWLAEIEAIPAGTQPEELTAEQLQSAKRQIEQMLEADPSEAVAIRERLARFGQGLVPIVRQELQAVSADVERQRLLALRYRLVADDSLVLTWPGGLERLADTNRAVRHQAAEELATMAAADSESLLLELFSDPDPLVREISLRGLQSIGGDQATAALTELLNDPEPNVRAAVLKQLTEDGSPQMLSKVIEYVKHEQDPDLIVHAIRYMRETGSSRAVTSLLELVSHESWQVRAEASEALGKRLETSRYWSPYGGGGDRPDRTIEIYDALLERLGDADSFVLSRALDGLKYVDAERAVEPLVNAAAAHPSLAVKIVAILAQGSQMRDAAVPHLREFFGREDPEVRAAAIRGLCKTDPEHVKEELLAAARDEDTLVRTAAATALLEMLAAARPGENEASTNPFGAFPGPFSGGAFVPGIDIAADSLAADSVIVAEENEGPSPTSTGEKGQARDNEDSDSSSDATKSAGKSDSAGKPESDEDAENEEGRNELDTWLMELYAGEHRAEWTSELVEPFQAMLTAQSSKERVAAALALIPFGKADRAVAVLLDTSRSHPVLLPQAAESLKWLLWEQRVNVFWELFELARNDAERATIVLAMNQSPDERAAEVYWEAIDRDDATEALAQAVQRSLSETYFGSRVYNASSINALTRKQAVDAITPELASGVPLKRLVAIDLLLKVAPDDALAGAKRLMNDSEVDEALRSDAFQITLAAQTNAQREQTAIESLSGEDDHRRFVSLKFLALGPSALANLPATGFTIDVDDGIYPTSNSGQPIIPKTPRQLKPEQVRPFLDNPSPEMAAYAGYLLAVMQEPSGLTPLLRHWRSEEQSEKLDRLVYRAISALDAAQHIPVLQQVYARLDEHQVGEFYWTIRIMSGPEMLAFRKEIRDEVGMSNLR